ncbi:Ribose-5-phosphate isomerase A [Buchnera aphidicola (Pemphigus immunis)]|uniref:ribose-5-phosphate isomerase RpiA n=1 Tax=Buchnera aphidicola TaxID=9 RepID=UPI003A758ADE
MIELNKIKKTVAWSALKYIYPGTVVGVGTGSTVSYFIEALSTIKHLIDGAVSSSLYSTKILRQFGIPIYDLNAINFLKTYVDGADEINPDMYMIKGGGAALTQEKIISSVADTFICIIDESKKVKTLGSFPLPVEVVPMAYSYVSNELIKLGGIPKYRENVVTDHGNIIIDIHNLKINDPIAMESKINSLPGVVTVGLFTLRTADIVLVGTKFGVDVIKNK